MSAAPTASGRAPSAVAPRRLPLARRVSFGGFAALIVIGVAFYLWWGLRTGFWLDNGVYAVAAVLIAFGLSGMWLVAPDPPAASPPTA
ncbi:MAG TPA: hypothetical protein VJS68_00375 [Thermoplasmata archaeon]|nr:hypothetical protein [Thermoplasmata archaeon]